MREAAGELVQPVVLGLYLQPLELGSLPLPALLDDARQTRYHQGEEPVILWPREPDEVRSRVDTDYRVERDRQAELVAMKMPMALLFRPNFGGDVRLRAGKQILHEIAEAGAALHELHHAMRDAAKQEFAEEHAPG